MPASRDVDQEELSEDDEELQEDDEDEDRDDGRSSQKQSKKRKGSAFIDDAAEEDDEEDDDEVCLWQAGVITAVYASSCLGRQQYERICIVNTYVQLPASNEARQSAAGLLPVTGRRQRQAPQEAEHFCRRHCGCRRGGRGGRR